MNRTFLLTALLSTLACGFTTPSPTPSPTPAPIRAVEIWLREPPGKTDSFQDIAREKYAEVPYSRRDTALRALSQIHLRPLSEEEVFYFLRRERFCTPTERPYLVRAGFYQGGTGDFFLYWSGSDKALVVTHGALGSATKYNKSALIVCLPTTPEIIYGTASTAL